MIRITIELVPSVCRGGGLCSIHDFDCIISRKNILHAWTEFQNGKKHKRDVADFSLKLDANLRNIFYDLKDRKYHHSLYTNFKISDPKPRDIHKAIVRDRVVHHLLYNAFYQYFDNKFIYDSYSCRKNKGTHKARVRFQYFYNKCSQNKTKQVWVLKCDIRKFFASIEHGILKSILARHIQDKDTLDLLYGIIDSFHIGLPLGNLTSQLLVNIYMNEFDRYIKHALKVKYYIRYADDFVILSKEKIYLEKLLQDIAIFLNQNLKLTLHPHKVSITTYSSGIDFLGFVYFPYHNTLRTVTKKRMYKNLKQSSTKEKLASYMGLLKWGNTGKLQKYIQTKKLYNFFL